MVKKTARMTVDEPDVRLGAHLRIISSPDQNGDPDHPEGPPSPGGLVAERGIGVVHWSLSVSYLDYTVDATVVMEEGDPAQYAFTVWAGPPFERGFTGFEDHEVATTPLSVPVSSSLFRNVGQVTLILTGNPGNEPVGIGCVVPGVCEVGSMHKTRYLDLAEPRN
jgi:hypothetical protein